MVVVLNCGSSSVKFSVYDGLNLLYHDNIQCFSDYEKTLNEVLEKLEHFEIEYIIHRVVHGGDFFQKPVLVDQKVLSTLQRLTPLAPLHNPPALEAIKFFSSVFQNLKQYCVFDTAFYVDLPDVAKYYAIKKDVAKQYHIKRYGFHGSSHWYLMLQVQNYLQKKPSMISLHLGGGSSICAIKDAKAVDISMGFTPLEGLMMGSRSGDLDPSVVLYLQKECGWNIDAIEDLLNKQSGIYGIAGYSDFQHLEAELDSNEEAKLAFDMMVYRICKYIGAYFTVLQQVDAIVFSGGIGQNSAILRAEVLKRLHMFGINFDKQKNQNHQMIISSDDSKVNVFVIPTDEERFMLEAVLKVRE